MYVDASAMVAIMLSEPEREAMIEQIGLAPVPVTSMVSIYEAMAAVGRVTMDRAYAGSAVEELLDQAEIQIVQIGAEIITHIQQAYRIYGKGSGHPAQLNMGDCFAYAMAKSLGVPLLYKGNDFTQTDLA